MSGTPVLEPVEYDPAAHPEAVMHLASQGLGDIALAASLGIPLLTFRRWLKAHAEFDEHFLKGRGAWNDSLQNSVESKLIEKALKGNMSAIQFLLKNVDPDKWKDRQEQKVTTVTAEDYEKAIRVETALIREKKGLPPLEDLRTEAEKRDENDG